MRYTREREKEREKERKRDVCGGASRERMSPLKSQATYTLPSNKHALKDDSHTSVGHV